MAPLAPSSPQIFSKKGKILHTNSKILLAVSSPAAGYLGGYSKQGRGSLPRPIDEEESSHETITTVVDDYGPWCADG